MFAVRHVLAICVAVFALVACDDGDDSTPAPDSIFPTTIEAEQIACESTGGRWGAAAVKATFVCYRDQPDANKSCLNSRQCRGDCLARSRTCTPFTPFYGCHQVLNDAGFPQTLCVE